MRFSIEDWYLAELTEDTGAAFGRIPGSRCCAGGAGFLVPGAAPVAQGSAFRGSPAVAKAMAGRGFRGSEVQGFRGSPAVAKAMAGRGFRVQRFRGSGVQGLPTAG